MKKITAIILALALTLGCAGIALAFDANREISVVSREGGSGTRGAFIELFGVEVKGDDGSKKDMTTDEAVIANKTDVMLTNIAGDEYAIGYVSIGSLNDSVKALNIDGAPATTAAIVAGDYTIMRPFVIATKSDVSELAADFIDYILSKEGQDIISGSYIAVVDDAQSFAGKLPEGKIVVGGSSSVTPVMEKLVEAYQALNDAATIEIQMTDSSAGMAGAIEGSLDIGMSSRDLKDEEKAELTDVVIALDGIAVIVNTVNPLDGATKEQVKNVFIGEVTSWSDLIAE